MYDKKNFVYLKKDILEINKYPFKFDYIIHAAGIPDPSNYYKFPVETLLLSISGTKKLLVSQKKINHLLLFSAPVKYMAILQKAIYPQKKHILEMLIQWAIEHVMMKAKE